MDRRGFLRMLGLGAAAAVAPTKAYSFLGGILRPRADWMTATEIMRRREEWLNRQINPPLVYDWIDMEKLVAEIGSNLGIPQRLLAEPFIRGTRIT